MEDRLLMLAEDEVIDVDDPVLLNAVRNSRRGYLSGDAVIHNLNIEPCEFIMVWARINSCLKLFGLRYERVEQDLRNRGIEPHPCRPHCRWR